MSYCGEENVAGKNHYFEKGMEDFSFKTKLCSPEAQF